MIGFVTSDISTDRTTRSAVVKRRASGAVRRLTAGGVRAAVPQREYRMPVVSTKVAGDPASHIADESAIDRHVLLVHGVHGKCASKLYSDPFVGHPRSQKRQRPPGTLLGRLVDHLVATIDEQFADCLWG